MFSSDDELKDHCCIIQKKLSSLDNIKLQYVRIIQDVKYNKNQLSNKIVSEATTAISDAFQMNLKLGYAIKHRLNSRFSNKQKEFLERIFTIGENDSSNKMSHAKVRLEMSKQFKFSETLKETQIKGSLANLIKKRKEAIKKL